MKKNITQKKRMLRLFTGLILLTIFLIDVVPFGLGVTCLAVSGPLFITALMGFCPITEIYKLKAQEIE